MSKLIVRFNGLHLPRFLGGTVHNNTIRPNTSCGVRSTVILVRIQHKIVTRIVKILSVAVTAAAIHADVMTSLLLIVVTMILLLRYERCTITTLFRRRDGLIILVVAVSHRIRLQILVGRRIGRRYCCCGRHRHRCRRLDSEGYNWVLCITRRPHLIEPKTSPIPDQKSPQSPRDGLISLDATTEQGGNPISLLKIVFVLFIVVVVVSVLRVLATAVAGFCGAKMARESPALADIIAITVRVNMTIHAVVPESPSSKPAP